MKIIRLNILDTLAEVDADAASESIAFDTSERSPTVRYVAVIKGIADTDRYIMTLQDEHDTVVDMSTTFAVTEEQLKIEDPTLTIELVCARIPRGVIRCVRVADLVQRGAQPLAS